jgi:hypothetical protein
MSTAIIIKWRPAEFQEDINTSPLSQYRIRGASEVLTVHYKAFKLDNLFRYHAVKTKVCKGLAY